MAAALTDNGVAVGRLNILHPIRFRAEHRDDILRDALKHAPVVVFTQDLQLRYTWITPPVLALDYRNLLGGTDAKSFAAWDHRSFVGCTAAEISC